MKLVVLVLLAGCAAGPRFTRHLDIPDPSGVERAQITVMEVEIATLRHRIEALEAKANEPNEANEK